MRTGMVLAAAIVALGVATPSTQQTDNLPAAPFRIADNLFYVGSSDIASYLITSPAGHILIDAGYVSTVPIIAAVRWTQSGGSLPSCSPQP